MYNAIVRRKKGPKVTMNNLHAIDIYAAAKMVRKKYGFDTKDPHKGFVINQSLTSSARIQE